MWDNVVQVVDFDTIAWTSSKVMQTVVMFSRLMKKNTVITNYAQIP